MLHYRRLLIVLAVLMLASCAARNLRPGAVSALDDQAYTILTISQAALSSTGDEIRAGNISPELLPLYNNAVETYNRTRILWLSYRENKTSEDGMSEALAILTTSIGELNRRLGRQP